MLCITKRKNHYIKIGDNITIYFDNQKSRYYIQAPKEVLVMNTLISNESKFSRFIKKDKKVIKQK